MSDFRNPNGFNSAPMAADEIRASDAGFGEKHVLNDNGGLSGFHHFEEEEEGSGKAKMIGGGLVVALLLGAAGLYAYTGSTTATMKAPASVVASNAAAPIQTAPIAPPAAAPAPDVASNTPTKSPYDMAPTASAPASDTASADTKSADKPVKTAKAHINKDETAQNSAADQATKNGSVAVPLPATPSVAANAAPVDAATPSPDVASATPLPTPPAPPASSVASNGQTVVTPPAGDTAQDATAAPAMTPEQQPVTPAAQPDQAQPAPVQPQ